MFHCNRLRDQFNFRRVKKYLRFYHNVIMITSQLISNQVIMIYKIKLIISNYQFLQYIIILFI